MARAKQHSIPGLIWHITQRCHNRAYLLKFNRDKKRWLFWLFEAKKRYGLCILNYAVTSNHIHLLVYDTGCINTIPRSIQLTAGRTGREYNQRKKRSGAFWEDHYHSTAVESGIYLLNCMIYIDMNMVRAGAVSHPKYWAFCGFNEIVREKRRYRLIDKSMLLTLLGISEINKLQSQYEAMVEKTIQDGGFERNEIWTENFAVGSKKYVNQLIKRMGGTVVRRKIEAEDGVFTIQEPILSYIEKKWQE